MPGTLTVPNVEVGVWPGFVVAGKAGGALTAGQVAVTADAISWTAATTGATTLKGVVLLDGTKDSFVTNDIVPILIYGVAVVKVDAAVLEGFPLEASSVNAAGQARSYVVGADANDVTVAKIFGKALTLGGTNAKALATVGL